MLRRITSKSEADHLVSVDHCYELAQYTKAQIEAMIDNRNYLVLGYYQQDCLCGYACVCLHDDQWELDKIVVMPQYRQLAIGSALMSTLVNDAHDHGIDSILLEVDAANSVALKLYEKFDFKLIHTRKNYYGNNRDALILERVMK